MAKPKMTITARAPGKSEFKLPKADNNLDAAKRLEDATQDLPLAQAVSMRPAPTEPTAPTQSAPSAATAKSLLRNTQTAEVTRFTVRLDSDTVQDLRVHCAQHRMTLTHAVTEALEEWFAKQKKK